MSSLSPSLSSASDEPSRYNIYSQRLNNSAALCIEIGQFERAILSLQRALRLCEAHMAIESLDSSSTDTSSRKTYACQCRDCTLDGCIAFSEANALAKVRESTTTSTTPLRDEDNHRSSKRRRQDLVVDSTETTSIAVNDHSYQTVESDEKDKIRSDSCGSHSNRNVEIQVSHSSSTNTITAKAESCDQQRSFTYRRPIRVKRQNHEMGPTLFLVILYNLALAHHLKAIELDEYTIEIAKTAKKSQLLYELIFEYWSRISSRKSGSDVSDKNSKSSNFHASTYGSIRFSMILYNNLSQLHRLTKNKIKERKCLQELLSAIMLVTDQQLASVQLGSNIYTESDTRMNVDYSKDLDGFLSNTASLTSQLCANAA